MNKRKEEIITLKVDGSFLEALKGIPNRSEYIRSAVLAALQNTCPLCGGTGILNPNQKSHWDTFSVDHSFDECNDCHERRIVCNMAAPRPADDDRR